MNSSLFGSRELVAACLLLGAWTAAASAQETIEGIGPRGELKRVATGFDFTEGPAADAKGNVYFTDIPKTTIHRLTPEGKVEAFTRESRHANGLMLDRQGRLVACEMAGQLVAWDLEKRQRHVLADQFEGKRFNAPNDLAIDAHGGIYFTDPHFRAPQPLPQGETRVYYWSPEGGVRRVTEGLPVPNGVVLSPDGKTLYVLPSGSDVMLAYEVKQPGELGEKRDFYRLREGGRGADGGTVDSQGNLYITSHLGVEVVSPTGKGLGVIKVPEKPTNVTFGGLKRSTLYITAQRSLYAAEMLVAGTPPLTDPGAESGGQD